MKFVCDECGEEFRGSRPRDKYNHVFCSRKCANRYNSKHREPKRKYQTYQLNFIKSAVDRWLQNE